MEINILPDAELHERLHALKLQGFDQIKLPGGTSKDRKHYSGVVIFHYDSKTKKSYFLGLPYDSYFHQTGDENGNTKKFGETPMQTAIRETMEESALIILEKDLQELINSRKELPDREDRTKIGHTKHFFLAKSFSGVVFNFEGQNPIDRETGAPLWIPVDLFAKILWIGHLQALKEAIQILSFDKEICMSLMMVLL